MEESLNTDSFHHNIVLGKMNLNVPLPSPYARKV